MERENKRREGEKEERCVRGIVGVRARRGAALFAKGSRIVVKAYYHINSEGKQLITRRPGPLFPSPSARSAGSNVERLFFIVPRPDRPPPSPSPLRQAFRKREGKRGGEEDSRLRSLRKYHSVPRNVPLYSRRPRARGKDPARRGSLRTARGRGRGSTVSSCRNALRDRHALSRGSSAPRLLPNYYCA